MASANEDIQFFEMEESELKGVKLYKHEFSTIGDTLRQLHGEYQKTLRSTAIETIRIRCKDAKCNSVMMGKLSFVVLCQCEEHGKVECTDCLLNKHKSKKTKGCWHYLGILTVPCCFVNKKPVHVATLSVTQK